MRNIQLTVFLLAVFALVFAGCRGTPGSRDEGNLLTMGQKVNITGWITKFDPDGKNLSWKSSAPRVVSVAGDGTVSAGYSRGTAVITVTAGEDTETFIVTTTLSGQEDMMDLPPMKDQFENYFMMGNIIVPGDTGGGTITNQRLTRHYSVLTAENAMKPQYLSPEQDRYTWREADNIVDAAMASGFKVVGHTLLWHSQIPWWQKDMANAGRETALAAMTKYVTDVVTRYKGKIYSWDVLNEVFPDGVGPSSDWKKSLRGDNPWARAIGSDFIYEGFLAARLADPAAILYYNDYNLDNTGKAMTVRNMVRDVNAQYRAAYPAENRLLIEGVGLQSHHNTGVSASSIRTSLELFKPLGVKIAISELDVLSHGYSEFAAGGNAGSGGKLHAANLYGEYFKLFIQYSDIIERVTFWGVYDEQSWRSRGLPQLFEGSPVSKAKPAYYRVIEALER